jgi:hypothetical protein
LAAIRERQRVDLLLTAVARAAVGRGTGLVFGLHRQDLSLGLGRKRGAGTEA